MALFDNHTHLNNERIVFQIDNILKSSLDVGVQFFICNGTYEEDWPHVADLSLKYPEIIPCFGIHPWYIRTRTPDWLNVLENLLERHHAGVGEIGLDYDTQNINLAEQEEVFKAQLLLAKGLGLPFVVHCRKAWDRLLGILNQLKPYPAGFMVHSFSGSLEVANKLISFGAYLSASTVLLRPNRERLIQTFAELQIDRVILESDTPDFSPDINRPNSPANLRPLVELIANNRKMLVTDLENQLWGNSIKLWGNIMKSRGIWERDDD